MCHGEMTIVANGRNKTRKQKKSNLPLTFSLPIVFESIGKVVAAVMKERLDT
jgi:hypothetical protein